MENLPFKPGQLAELRSFGVGYRGAWFRCKIREITKRNGILGHISEYYDYTDGKINWTKLYSLRMGNAKRKHSELMLRPQYPPICNENQMPHVSEISEVTVIVCDSWKVGDLVDLFHTGCYWSGRITQLFDDQKAQIELRPPPLGEGSFYTALFKDLRPSLDWSLEHGWTLPTQEDGFGHPCARLIKPVDQVIERVIQVEDLHNVGKETASGQRSAASSLFSSPVSSNSATSDAAKSTTKMLTCSPERAVSKKQKHKQERSTSPGPGDSSTTNTSWAVANSRHNETEPAAEVAQEDSRQNKTEPSAETAQEELNLDHCQEKHGAAGQQYVLHSKLSDHIEAAILDLEEYVNKVKWLKKFMKHGISSSDTQVPQWKIVEKVEIPK